MCVILAPLPVSWQPCFVSKVSNLGHTWAAAIRCHAVEPLRPRHILYYLPLQVGFSTPFSGVFPRSTVCTNLPQFESRVQLRLFGTSWKRVRTCACFVENGVVPVGTQNLNRSGACGSHAHSKQYSRKQPHKAQVRGTGYCRSDGVCAIHANRAIGHGLEHISRSRIS